VEKSAYLLFRKWLDHNRLANATISS
jgi:hypothetical protein